MRHAVLPPPGIVPPFLILLCGALLCAGCAGPNKITRGVDERMNQLYVDSPLMMQAALPLHLAGTNLAMAVDWCFVNPWYFWHDAPAGRGSAYYYRDPRAPENPDPITAGVAPAPGKGAKVGKGARGFSEPDLAPGLVGATASAGVTSSAQPVPAVAPAPAGPRRSTAYTVKPGDTLISIARSYYGSGKHWKQIYMANQTVLRSADALEPGLVLVLPVAE